RCRLGMSGDMSMRERAEELGGALWHGSWPAGGTRVVARLPLPPSVRPSTAVLVVTMFDDDYSVFTAMRAGARGYVLKDADEEEVLRSIRAVGYGEAIFSPAIARRMMDFFAVPRSGTPPHAFPQLSQREREVLGL